MLNKVKLVSTEGCAVQAALANKHSSASSLPSSIYHLPSPYLPVSMTCFAEGGGLSLSILLKTINYVRDVLHDSSNLMMEDERESKAAASDGREKVSE